MATDPNAKPLAVGDTVQLKCGGPDMCVTGTSCVADRHSNAKCTMVNCAWFANRVPYSASYPLECLVYPAPVVPPVPTTV